MSRVHKRKQYNVIQQLIANAHKGLDSPHHAGAPIIPTCPLAAWESGPKFTRLSYDIITLVLI